nr:RHS repeat-associated core domain-containing protein [uncultured Clostridium sp.]
MTDVTGKRLHYGYDWRGKLTSIKDDDGREIVRYSHRKDGRLETITHLSGIKTLYEYDTDGNISRLATFLSESSPLFDYRYEYDLNGNRTAKEGVCVMAEERCVQKTAVCYRYDSMNRLTDEIYDGDAAHYVYDRCGNRLEKTAVAGKETYCYNRRNQLIERNASGRNYTYRYDDQGNIMEEAGDGEERRYLYNPFGQQTAVVSDKLKLENFYDGEQLRAGKSVNGKVSRFIFYNGEMQAEADEDLNAISRHIPGYGVAASEVEGQAGYHAYHLDERNNTAYITGSQRSVENFYEYDAFGAIRRQSEEIQNRILYTGQQYDQETAQYYLRARFYNPVVGRFLQEDVYRGDGLNLYAYCANNPVMYYDPSGYQQECKNGTDAVDNGDTTKQNGSTKGSGQSQKKLTNIVGYEGDVNDPNVRLYGTYGELSDAGVNDGHHLLQDAAMRDVDGYSKRSAPAIQADGPSTLIGSEHYNLTYDQSHATQAGTYGIEKKIGLDSATKNLNLNSAESSTLNDFIDNYFVNDLGLNNNSPTRKPGNRHHLNDN